MIMMIPTVAKLFHCNRTWSCWMLLHCSHNKITNRTKRKMSPRRNTIVSRWSVFRTSRSLLMMTHHATIIAVHDHRPFPTVSLLLPMMTASGSPRSIRTIVVAIPPVPVGAVPLNVKTEQTLAVDELPAVAMRHNKISLSN
uniref:Uncharacterized protein n=1 Tax=Anopheles triannulatus TaxID=58253 RepID=A0A2M4B0N6_9DIPT